MLTKVAALTIAAVVSLGDSFVSGEGGGGYGASGGCHRSATAPIRSAPIGGVAAINLACSGARTSHLLRSAAGGEWLRGEPPQGDRLAAVARAADVRLIVVAAGANDLGFGRIVARCALDWARSEAAAPRLCRRRSQADLAARLPAMRRGLTRALRGVRATMAAAGARRGEYRLVAMGYSSPFPGGGSIRYPEWGWSRLREGGCPLWNGDAEWASGRAVRQIAAAIRAAARRVGAEFLDLRRALDGHRLCERGVSRESADPAAAEWVTPLRFDPARLRESLHPNAFGQRAIGICIALHFAQARGDYACRPTPGRGSGEMRLEWLG